MPRYSPEQIETNITKPLTGFLGDITRAVDKTAALIKEGKIPENGLLLTPKGALDGILALQSLLVDIEEGNTAAAYKNLLDNREKARLKVAAWRARKKAERAGQEKPEEPKERKKRNK